MINLEEYSQILENLNKVRKIVSKNLILDVKGNKKLDMIYNKLNKFQLAKPLYISWFLNMHIKKVDRWEEDIQRGLNVLAIYDKNIKSIPQNKQLFDKAKKGFRYIRVHDLEDLIEDIVGSEVEELNLITNKTFIENKEVKVLLDNNRWLVIDCLTQEANNFYGQGSRWCTVQTPDIKKTQFNFYKRGGNIYIIIDKSKIDTNQDDRRFQLHFKSNQFMDIKDRPDMSFIDDAEIYKLFSREILEIDYFEIYYTKNQFMMDKTIKVINKLPNLKTLAFDQIYSDTMTISSVNSKELETLNITNMKIKSFGTFITPKLKKITIEYCSNLKNEPKIVSEELREVIMQDTTISNLPYLNNKKLEVYHYYNPNYESKILNISSKSLDKLHLDINNENFININEFGLDLPKLTKFALRTPYLQTTFKVITSLNLPLLEIDTYSQSKELDLSDMNIEQLPETINVGKIKILNLQNNKITHFPKIIAPNLEVLNFYGNNIKSINLTSYLPKLNKLVLGKNEIIGQQFKDVDELITKFKSN